MAPPIIPSSEIAIPSLSIPLPDVPIPGVSVDFNHLPVDSTNSPSPPLNSNPPLRKSTRVSKPPAYLQDYKCSNVTCADHALSNLTNKSSSTPITSGTKYPLSHYLESSKLSSSYSLYCSLIATIPEPKFYHKVVKDPKWQDAIIAKINALESNNTWTLTPLPSYKRAISYKWVYRVKYKADGSMKRYNARLVVKGCTQQEGL